MISSGSIYLIFLYGSSKTNYLPRYDSRLSVLSAAKMEFGLIPREHWFQPESIDENKATASREKMMEQNIIYGGSVSYRNMCRFNSGVSNHRPQELFVQLIQISIVFLQASIGVEIPMVLAHRVRHQTIFIF